MENSTLSSMGHTSIKCPISSQPTPMVKGNGHMFDMVNNALFNLVIVDWSVANFFRNFPKKKKEVLALT